MAKKEVSNTTENKLSNSIFKTSRGQKFIVGVLFVIVAIILLLSFISYYISGSNDQSQITELGNRDVVVENWLPGLSIKKLPILNHTNGLDELTDP